MRRGLAVLAGIACLLAACRPAPTPRAVPLVHSAYVWRQGWDARAAKGLAADVIPTPITQLSVLVGECGLAGGSRSVRVPWDAVKASGRKIELAVRVGSRRDGNAPIWANLDQGVALLSKGLQSARSAGIEVSGVQIDFDCPTRLLAEYAEHLRALRPRLGEGVALSITTLPSWLKSSDFKVLIGTVDSWTLQVHGTSKPSLAKPTPLFDADQSLEWIDQACRLGKPFRVALPTYSYLACFSEKGTFLGMRAEGGGGLPEGTASTQCLPSSPEDAIKLLRALQDAHYNNVRVVDWYRLPLPGDVQAWTAKGLGKVLAGERLESELRIQLDRQGALTDITLVNPTDQPLPLIGVRIEWDTPGKLVGADGTVDWLCQSSEKQEVESKKGGETPRGVRFELRPGSGFMAPGERRVVGWVRLDGDQPVRAEAAAR